MLPPYGPRQSGFVHLTDCTGVLFQKHGEISFSCRETILRQTMRCLCHRASPAASDAVERSGKIELKAGNAFALYDG